MTKEQKYKIKAAIDLVTDSLNNLYNQESRLEKTIKLLEDALNIDNKAVSVWLSVAGDYCKEVAEELKC